MKADLPRYHVIREDSTWGPLSTVIRSDDPTPYIVAAGARYFLIVWPDGLEQNVQVHEHAFGSGRVQGALEVHVIAVRGRTVTEDTWTWNRPNLKRAGYTNSIAPPGRGWKIADASDDKTTRWRRKRTWSVV